MRDTVAANGAKALLGEGMRLRHRILLGYLVPILLLIGVLVTIYANLQALEESEALADHSRRVVREALTARVHFQAMQLANRRALLLGDDLRGDVASAAEAMEASLQKLDAMIAHPEQQADLREARDLAGQLLRGIEQMVGLVARGERAQALELFQGELGYEGSAQLADLFERLVSREYSLLDERRADEKAWSQRLYLTGVAAAALALVFGVLAALLLAARIGRGLGEAVSEMGATSAEIAATVEEHERVVNQQVAGVTETNETVDTLAVSARQSATQAEASTDAAQQSLELVQAGLKHAEGSARSVQEMKARIDAVAGQILRLSEQVGEIGSIARLVGELAGETKMLALNAAVEAARAGEQGKGFAVVAAEVRRLAEQSKKSAEHTDALVGAIQRATNDAVMVTEQGTRSADDAVASTRRAGEAFSAIAETVEDVLQNSQQVLLNSRQQAAALGQIKEAMESLEMGSRQTASGTEQTRVGLRQLNDTAARLRRMV